MATIWSGWYWHLGLASLLAMGGAIATLSDCALAQVTPDGTLGAESSVVTPTNVNGIPSEQIDGGATRGANLFHSFEQFSVPTGGEAFFNNAASIQNIISRVTGGSISNIDGLLRANGTANLFLLNPNGIIFGPNASLNIGGSFVGSTASSLNFPDGNQFSATDPQAPPLLTVNVPLGLQYGGTAGSIVNQSRATNSSGELVGLQVLPGKTLSLVGGDVWLDGGRLQASGGRVELGGVAGAGTVGLNVDGSNLSLSYPASVQRADVSLTNGAIVDVAAGGGGSIAVNARNLDVSGGSTLSAGIGTGLGSVTSQAGDITLNATGTITVAGSSNIFNTVSSGAVGKGGDINILAESLSLDNALLGAFTSGQGDAGSISVRASDSVSATNNSGFLSIVSSGAVGKGGNIDIKARSLSLTDGAQIFTSTFGQGDAGTISVQVDDSVSLADNSLISNSVVSEAVGKGGNIDIQARSLSLTNTARLNTSTFGQGNAGSVFVRASDSVSLANSSIFSNVFSEAVGTGGEINIQAGSLSLTDNATLSTNTYGQGDAGSVSVQTNDSVSVANSFISSGVFTEAVGKGGNINIQTRSLSLTDSTQLSAITFGQGDAGSVFVAADDSVSVTTNSLITSAVGWQAVGKAGNIDIQARSLSLTDDAVLSTSTSGQGNAGSVSVQTNDSVSLSDSVIASSVLEGGVGNGGLIDINTGSLSLSDSAQILTDVRGASEERAGGRGNAGSVNIDVRNTVTIAGRNDEESLTGIFSDVEAGAVGNGGLIGINAESLSLSDGAQVNVSSLGSGNAGNLEVRAGSIRLDNKAFLSSNTTGGQGNIELRSGDLVLRRGSNITTNATGTATGGNITIDSDVIAALSDSDISANALQGSGGQVIIDASGIFGTEFREDDTSQSDITASSDLGPEFSGTVEINNPDVDPTQGLVELPAELVDASNQIATGCPDAVWRGESKFIITGRGGLPPSPTEPLRGDNTLTNWSTLEEPELENRSSTAPATNSTKESAPTTIVEANGWVKGPNGEVTLFATAPTATLDIPWLPESSCNAPEPNS